MKIWYLTLFSRLSHHQILQTILEIFIALPLHFCCKLFVTQIEQVLSLIPFPCWSSWHCASPSLLCSSWGRGSPPCSAGRHRMLSRDLVRGRKKCGSTLASHFIPSHPHTLHTSCGHVQSCFYSRAVTLVISVPCPEAFLQVGPFIPVGTWHTSQRAWALCVNIKEVGVYRMRNGMLSPFSSFPQICSVCLFEN